MKKHPLVLSLVLMLALSCSTDFDINGDWQACTIVYGIVNQNDTITYIKINKAFLGEGDVMQMALEPDSSEYPYKLNVRLEEFVNGIYVRSREFDTTTIYNKEEGQFYYPRQKVYKADTRNWFNEENTYKLVVENPVRGESFYAQTVMVYPFSIERPKPSQKIIDFSLEGSTPVEWKSGKNGRRYQLMIRFNYKELALDGSSDTVFKSVDWLFPSYTSTKLNGGEDMRLSYSNPFFYDLLQSKIPANANVKRFFGKKGYSENDTYVIEFIFSVAADEFSTYLDVFEPSTGIIQEKPQYTNLKSNQTGKNDVLGIFSSRYQVFRQYKLGDLTKQRIQELNLGF